MSRMDDAYTLRLLEEMVTINSVVGQEGKLAEYLYAQLEALGVPCELQRVEQDRFNVYARLMGSGSGRRLNFNAHLDTVPVCEGWASDPFRPLLKDGRLYGLGACDMKGGIACILTMLKAFVESGQSFQGELSFSGVVDEEAYSKGARAMLDTDLAGCDAIVLAEPYSGEESKPIPLGITGKVLYHLTVRGHAAHGFRPHLGINAVEEAARVVAALDRLPMREHPDFGRGNTCTLKIEGGYQIYSVVVPDVCRVEINRLLVPGETSDMAVEDMKALVRSLDLEAVVEVELKPPRYEPFLVRRDEPIIQILDKVYPEMVGRAPAYGYNPSITDANVFGERGIPCLHLGPAGGNIHEPNEYVSLEWLELVPRMYAALAMQFLSGAR